MRISHILSWESGRIMQNEDAKMENIKKGCFKEK